MFSFNSLTGSLPEELSQLPILTFSAEKNELSGILPSWLGKWNEMDSLLLSSNRFIGKIPPEVGIIWWRVLFLARLHHRVFDLSYNRLSGLIPEELGNCVVVVDLLLSNNMLSGSIPLEFGDSLKLQRLYLGNNQLTGSIPGSLDRLGSLVKLNLTGNKLSGSVPIGFGNLTGLTHLDLSCNKLDGELPSSLSQMLNLVGLYVQQNSLSGPLDGLYSNSIMAWRIETMNLSNNVFDGALPQSLGNLSYLTNLDLHENKFTGEIPPELCNLMQLEYFDVSRNQLSGQIREKMCHLVNLQYLNLADNGLEGLVPESGICQNLSKITLAGNKDLCGRVLGLDCQIRTHDKSALLNAWGLAEIVVGSALIILTVVCALQKWIVRSRRQNDPEDNEESKLNSFIVQDLYLLSSSRSKEPLSINVATFEQPLLKLTLVDIIEATNNFCKTNIIGDGGFGTVYKATLPDEKSVAVKKLSEAKTQGNREFSAEMETLGKVKHQNLVPLLGYCSFGEEKFDSVQLLLDLHANVSAVTFHYGTSMDLMGAGSSPLHYAACGGNLKCCQILLARGASRMS
ncbi:hypothetical protein Patl1_07499 [Pistacia atlantica]|uniref:Uncharacterized protein n=1 Tax=Pistacia atlantica TaxID=434234 RepID=A0ACC1AI65_9ROSI|nr:hypothetical protein Patl1_07499 [Pistacia atlantica]